MKQAISHALQVLLVAAPLAGVGIYSADQHARARYISQQEQIEELKARLDDDFSTTSKKKGLYATDNGPQRIARIERVLKLSKFAPPRQGDGGTPDRDGE